MTNVKALSYVLTLEGIEIPTDVRERLEAIKTSIEKKNGSAKKPTKVQTENIGIKQNILDAMVKGTRYTITDMMKQFGFLADFSNQKVSALVRQLKDEGSVTRVDEKGKAYFSLASTDEDAEAEE